MPAANKNNNINNNINKENKIDEKRQLSTSTKIALSGVLSALCISFMFLTGVLPFLQYAIPALCGFFLVIIALEVDVKTAMVAYCATSFLAIITTPDKEAALLFILFFGHYGILKIRIDTIKSKVLRVIVKVLLFNATMILSFTIIIYFFGMTEVINSFGPFGKTASAIILLVLGNIFFAIYEFALDSFIKAYILIFRKKMFKK